MRAPRQWRRHCLLSARSRSVIAAIGVKDTRDTIGRYEVFQSDSFVLIAISMPHWSGEVCVRCEVVE